MFSFCSPKVAYCVNFVPSRCKICCDFRAFLGVRFGLEDLLRVKDLTFCNFVVIVLNFAVLAVYFASSRLFTRVQRIKKTDKVAVFP